MSIVFIIVLMSLLGFGLFGLIVIVLIALAKLLLGGSSRKSRDGAADETRIIQEIYSGLARMEQRVESLETILLDSEKGAGTRT